jgi:hypothetical protein
MSTSHFIPISSNFSTSFQNSFLHFFASNHTSLLVHFIFLSKISGVIFAAALPVTFLLGSKNCQTSLSASTSRSIILSSSASVTGLESFLLPSKSASWLNLIIACRSAAVDTPVTFFIT